MPINMPPGNGKLVIRAAGGGGVPAPTTIAEDLVDSNTSLLLRMQGFNGSPVFADSSTYQNRISAIGSVAISTAQSQFGGASGLFNGGYLTIPYTSNFDLSGGADFTIESWFNQNSPGGAILSKDTYGQDSDWNIGVGSTSISFQTNKTNSQLNVTVPTISLNQWHHVAVVRYSGTNTIYLDGVAYGSNTMAITNDSQHYMTIGCYSWNNPGGFFNGYIDELRISKGVARYTGNFTPPSTAFYELSAAQLPSSPTEGQVVYANAQKSVVYVCINAAGPVWTRYTV